MQFKIVVSTDIDLLVPILHEADEDDARIVDSIMNTANTTYALLVDDQCVGAAMVQWQADESEIMYIAIRQEDRGKGYGKWLIDALIDLARKHPTTSLIVGTASTSVGNSLFYQKCGFRIDAVRKDFFSYVQTPVYEHGIRLQDMLMFRHDLNNG